jgi:hypothetical protein
MAPLIPGNREAALRWKVLKPLGNRLALLGDTHLIVLCSGTKWWVTGELTIVHTEKNYWKQMQSSRFATRQRTSVTFSRPTVPLR